MITTKTELKKDVREMTGYTSVNVLSDDGLDTAYRTARRHIRLEKSIELGFDWYASDNQAERDALFWFTCLFAKVQTGELDSQDLQAGAIDVGTLLAKEDNEVTVWYRRAHSALDSINSDNIIRSSSPARTDREYEQDGFSEQSSGTEGSEVDSTDL